MESKIYPLNDLLQHPLYPAGQGTLIQFMQREGERFAYQPVEYTKDGFNYRDGGYALINGQKYRLNLSINWDMLLGYVQAKGDLYLVVFCKSSLFVRFVRMEVESFSCRNPYFGGGIYGVYHFEKEYPELVPLFDLFSGRCAAA